MQRLAHRIACWERSSFLWGLEVLSLIGILKHFKEGLRTWVPPFSGKLPRSRVSPWGGGGGGSILTCKAYSVRRRCLARSKKPPRQSPAPARQGGRGRCCHEPSGLPGPAEPEAAPPPPGQHHRELAAGTAEEARRAARRQGEMGGERGRGRRADVGGGEAGRRWA